MNTNILQKCIAELQKDKPDLSYLRGMLETLMEIQKVPEDAYLKADGTGKVIVTTPKQEIKKAVSNEVMDEAAILNSKAANALATVQKNSLEIV